MRRLIEGLAVVAVTLAVAAPAARADATPEYFAMPAGIKAGEGLDTAPDGTVYFGTVDGSQRPPLARLDPALAVPETANGITLSVATPPNETCCATQIRQVAFSSALNELWWTRSDGVVGRTDFTQMKSTTLPGLVAPFGIAAAADGSAWFTEYDSGPAPARNGGRVAQITPDLGLTELPNLANQTGVFDSSRFDPKPKGITIDDNGTPWFAEYSAGLPGYRIARVSGAAYTEYFPPCVAGSSYCSGQASGSALSDVAAGRDGAIWYTNELKRTVGRLVPDQTVTEFPLAQLGTGLGAGTPRAISVAPDGTLWLAVHGGAAASANAIVKIVPSDPPVATTWTLGARLGPLAVAPDNKGSVWFSGGPLGGAGLIGRLVGVTGTTTPDGGGGGGGGTTPPPAGTPATGTAGTTTTTLTTSIVAAAKVSDPRVRGTSITANQICVGPPQDRCSLVYLIQTHEYVKGFPNTNGMMAAAKQLTTIGKATVTLKGGQSKKVTVKLNSKGRKLLKKIKKFKATFTVTQSQNGKKPKTILKKNVRFKK